MDDRYQELRTRLGELLDHDTLDDALRERLDADEAAGRRIVFPLLHSDAVATVCAAQAEGGHSTLAVLGGLVSTPTGPHARLHTCHLDMCGAPPPDGCTGRCPGRALLSDVVRLLKYSPTVELGMGEHRLTFSNLSSTTVPAALLVAPAPVTTTVR